MRRTGPAGRVLQTLDGPQGEFLTTERPRPGPLRVRLSAARGRVLVLWLDPVCGTPAHVHWQLRGAEDARSDASERPELDPASDTGTVALRLFRPGPRGVDTFVAGLIGARLGPEERLWVALHFVRQPAP